MADLLARMTLEEKVGQMCQMEGRRDPGRWVRKGFGSLLHTLGPVSVELQKMAAETRLGIPVLFGIDAIHGHAFWPKATVFPSQLGLSCTWDPALVHEVGRITALESSLTGIHWTFSPVLGTARDLGLSRGQKASGRKGDHAGLTSPEEVCGHRDAEPQQAEQEPWAGKAHRPGPPAPAARGASGARAPMRSRLSMKGAERGRPATAEAWMRPSASQRTRRASR